MSEPKIRWQQDRLRAYGGSLPGRLYRDYIIYRRRDRAYELYKFIETGVAFHGRFLDLESAKSHAEQLETNK